MKKIVCAILLTAVLASMCVACQKTDPVKTKDSDSSTEGVTTVLATQTTPAETTKAQETTVGATDVTSNTPTTTAPVTTGKSDSSVDIPEKKYNILFVGNSYTFYNDMPTMIFAKLLKKEGYDVYVKAITCGGYYLSQFADPNNKYGAQVYEALSKDASIKYDYVILQDQSVSPALDGERGAFYDAARKLVALVKESGAEPVFYATWSRKAGSSVLTDNGWTTEDMTYRLAAAYTAIANELGAKVAYAGLGFADVYSKTSAVELHDPDKSHPSYAGSYLAALTFYSTIFGKDPTEVSYNGSLSISVSSIIKESVKKAVFDTPEIPEAYRTTSEGVHASVPEYLVDVSQMVNLTALPTDSTLISVLQGGEYPNGKTFSGVLGDKNQIASTAYSLSGFTDEQKKDIADIGYGVSVIGVEKINSSSGEETAFENLVNGHWGVSFMCNITFDEKKYNVNGVDDENAPYRALITVNLGDVFNIDAFGWASGSLEGFPGAAEVFVSEDGENWTVVKSACYDKVNGKSIVACSDASTLKDPWNGNTTQTVCLFDMGGVKAKYIRIGVVIGRSDTSSKYNTINTREILVYGNPITKE